jgi:hypothetical protein
MPLFYFTCESCSRTKKFLMTPEEAAAPQICQHEDCGGLLKRSPQAPTSRVVEVRDNGLQPRAVEQLKDIEQMLYERAHKDYSKTE